MKTIFLVSSLDLIHADTEIMFLDEAVKKRELESKLVCWDNPDVKWTQADLVINRTTSTYFNNPPRFLKWAKKVEETTNLWNQYKIIQWNINKKYLIQLQEKGIPTPETILIPHNTEQPMESILETVPWDDFIIKPCIGAGSGGLRRFNKYSPDLETHFRNLNKNGFTQHFYFGDYEFVSSDTLLQPYIPDIEENGEASLIFFGGNYSHSMIKRVKHGDFRAHPIWGATIQRYSPSEEEVEVALQSLEAVGYPVEFARVDMIPTDNGPLIIEVELIDPNLFFDHLPETAETFADHIENFLKR